MSGRPSAEIHRSAWPRPVTAGLSLVMLVLGLAWTVRFIWSTSFRFGSQRVFCLFDDAMISLSYARSLVEGRGLTWGRQAEPVEGFTNPLWTLLMAMVELVPLENVHRPLLVQVAGMTMLFLCWWCLARALERLLASESARWAWVLAGACMAVYPLWYWSLLGLEVGLQSLVLILLAAATIRPAEDEPRAFEIVLAALAPLVRMDLMVGIAIALGTLWMRGSRRRALVMGASAVGGLAAYQTFRWFYFGAALPNTYYLKMTGEPLWDRLERGAQLFAANPTLWVVVAVFLAVGARAVWVRDVRIAALVAVPLAYVAYTVYVGGDAWDLEFAGVSRFTAAAMPLGLCAVVATLDRLGPRKRWLISSALVLLVLTANGWIGPGSGDRRSRQLGAEGEPYLVASHRIVFSEVQALEQRFGGHDLAVSTCWAGIPAYFSDFRWIDCLGYTDRELARLPVNGPAGALDLGIVAGHNKRYPELVLDREPDIVYQLWGYGSVDQLLSSRGYRRTAEGWWIRRGLLRRLRSAQ